MSLDDSQLSQCPRNERLRLFGVPLLLLVAAAVSLSIDIRVASYFKQGGFSNFFAELLENAEPFGHGLGACAVIMAVVLLDPDKRSRVGWLVGGSLGSGALASAAKLLVARSRPRDFDLLNGTVWDTFGGWLPTQRITGLQSFPSSHTVTAVGLAVVLAAWYPRGRWLFATLAVLVGMNRLQFQAHFPSDVFAGAALGWLVGSCCVLGDRRWSMPAAHASEASG
ncbi:MAG: phosphatase PAP2 family protein [Planctomycetota bacterium]